ncbi:hypothetical protein [Brachybacterium massiliense]|uniref:hypothetical protein n=1 Tax=Brachybacterium massiliense TaxID=1755098 RepID=UPI000B3BB2B5|nr:hypothetical protein [Brachybacterium massiliense]
MNDPELSSIESARPARRAALKGAAWSAPVIAMAITAPLVAASVNNASLAQTDTETDLLSLRLLDGGGGLLTAQALVTVPTELTLSNGSGAISGETATITIAVGRPGGINIPTGTVRGFGVASFDGVNSTEAERTFEYRRTGLLNVPYGAPTTTFSRVITVDVDSNGNLVIPVEFGLAGTSTSIVSVSLLASYPVTYTLAFASGASYSASGTISVPVGAGIL